MSWVGALSYLLGLGLAAIATGLTDKPSASIPLLISGAGLMYWGLS